MQSLIKEKSISFTKMNDDKKVSFTIPRKEGHIIDDVPYVSQEKSSFCSYACPTMIFKHFEVDIDLSDLLFNSGVGYSLVYSYPDAPYYLLGGTLLSQWRLDKEFVADLYGLKYESWYPKDTSSSLNDKWGQYWKKLKEYIKNDIPVSTSIDLSVLPSLRELIREYSWIDTIKVPDYFWNIVSTAHEIVIVGFDEEENLIYFNDPATSIIGEDNKQSGKYTSVPLDIFAKAVSRAKLGGFSPKFLINIYNKNKKSLSDDAIFKKSHERNIKRIKGNVLSYDHFWQKYPLGLNALSILKKDFEMVLDNKKPDLISFYRRDAFKINLIKKLCLFFIKRKDIPLFSDVFDNFYTVISTEKKYIVEYLKNKNSSVKSLESEIEYFREEINSWNQLSENYSIFYKQIFSSKQLFKEIIFESYASPISNIIKKEKNIGTS